jgi:hypothetical protein
MSNAETPRAGHDGAATCALVRVELSVRPEDRDYLDRRAAAECGGDRAAALGRVIGEARRFRHELRGKLGALDLIELCLTSNAMTAAEAASLVAELRREIHTLIEGATGE